jgi:hypothetical protein
MVRFGLLPLQKRTRSNIVTAFAGSTYIQEMRHMDPRKEPEKDKKKSLWDADGDAEIV